MPTSPRVFIADDDADMRRLIRLALEKDGCEVFEARDGAELIDLLDGVEIGAGDVPDVVITDVYMPNFSGLGVLRTLRQARSHLPVILITVDPVQAVQSDARQWGAAAVFAKPFDLEDLRTAVANARRLRFD
jgi:two-component system response regulator (stage 0 sporulation protein F)